MEANIIIFFIGCATGFMDALIGCGGLIAIPMLIITGMPPSVAIATDRFGCLGSGISSTYRFLKSGHIVKKYLFPLSILAVAASFLGANLLLSFDESVLKKTIGVLLILLLPVIFLKKDLGLKGVEPKKKLLVCGYIAFFFLEIYAISISIASGVFILLALNYFFGMNFLQANATLKPISLLGTVIALLVFANNGLIDYFNGIILFIGMLIGGYVGASLAIKGGSQLLRYALVVLIIFSTSKLLDLI